MHGRLLALAAVVCSLAAAPAVASAATPDAGHWSGATVQFRVESHDGFHYVVPEGGRGSWDYATVSHSGHWKICHTSRGAIDRHQCVSGVFSSPTEAHGEIETWHTPPGHPHHRIGSATHHQWTAELAR